MKTTKVSTWLPLFSGFYETIWSTDNDEEMELEYLNEERKNRGMPEITWDDVDWDYNGYQKNVVRGMTESVGEELIKQGFISAYKLQKLNSPREYNFANDSIHVAMTVTESNKNKIQDYLNSHLDAFATYIKDHYTSYDGFCSSYSNDVNGWLDDIDGTVTNQHMLASVLSFILQDMDQITEEFIHDDLAGNGARLQAKNYSKLLPELALAK